MPPVPTPLLGSHVQVHRSGLTAPYWTICHSRTRTLCTNFLLADSLPLDWHPIFNTAPGRPGKLLRIRKAWTAKPPTWTDNQGANPMLPYDYDNCTYRGGGELVLGCWKQLHTNKPRGRKKEVNMEKNYSIISHKHKMRLKMWRD
jgi:hypothetical protein